jgi:uncharacterized membrane protein YczE
MIVFKQHPMALFFYFLIKILVYLSLVSMLVSIIAVLFGADNQHTWSTVLFASFIGFVLFYMMNILRRKHLPAEGKDLT